MKRKCEHLDREKLYGHLFNIEGHFQNLIKLSGNKVNDNDITDIINDINIEIDEIILQVKKHEISLYYWNDMKVFFNINNLIINDKVRTFKVKENQPDRSIIITNIQNIKEFRDSIFLKKLEFYSKVYTENMLLF